MATESSFVNADNQEIFCCEWNSDDQNSSPKGLIAILHGGAEHIGRYNEIADKFTSKGFIVAAHDQRGHGRSEGPRLFVNTFEEYVKDAVTYYQKLSAKYPQLPFFILAHSMGATVATSILLNHPDIKVKGIVYIGPAFVSTKKSVPTYKVYLAKFASKIYPQMEVAPIEASWMLRDEKKLDEYINDPLVYRGGVKAKWGLAYLDFLTATINKLNELRTPFFTLHGTEDNLWSCKGSQLVYDKASSVDKTIKMFEEAFHQIHQEPGPTGEECVKEIISWIEERTV